MPATTLAQELFARLNSFEKVSALVNSQPPTFESEFFDLKGAAKLAEEDLKRIWSKALSGFANTGGGVVVFGVDCRKDGTGKDCASGLSLAPSAPALKSRLLELHSYATDPPIQGVMVEAYTQRVADASGVVVCLIPESPDRPHPSGTLRSPVLHSCR
jgi:predicted HTH transcriptional regulator